MGLMKVTPRVRSPRLSVMSWSARSSPVLKRGLTPPLVTLVAVFAVKQVLVALLLGIWVGATFTERMNPAAGLLRTFDKYFVNAFTENGHAGVILFTLMLSVVKVAYLSFVFDMYWDTQYHEDKVFGNLIADNL